MAEPGQVGGLPDLATTVSTLAMFATGSGAESVTVVLDQGDEHAAVVVSLDAVDGTVEVVEADEARVVPDASVLKEAEPLGRLHLHSFPPFEVDLDDGRVTGVIGGVDHLAKGAVQLAALFGGRTVVGASFATVEGPPLEVGARADGEAALSCGGVEFESPDGWPGA